jgi:hypothetical protein
MARPGLDPGDRATQPPRVRAAIESFFAWMARFGRAMTHGGGLYLGTTTPLTLEMSRCLSPHT